MAKFGWGICKDCGSDVCATKSGLAVRHGFIRVRRGYIRPYIPNAKSGRDNFPCPGSGKPLKNWFNPNESKQGEQ